VIEDPMKHLIPLAKALQWPATFLVLALVLNDKWHVTAVTLALAFRHELAAVLRRRRLILRAPGFRCRLDGDVGAPVASARNPQRR
jgi:hypothetical protein